MTQLNLPKDERTDKISQQRQSPQCTLSVPGAVLQKDPPPRQEGLKWMTIKGRKKHPRGLDTEKEEDRASGKRLLFFPPFYEF